MRLLILLGFLPVFTCNQEIPIEPNYYAQVNSMDTTTSSGNSLDYWLASDSTVMIAWSNSAHEKIGILPSEKMPGWAPHYYYCEFENFIGMRYSCGCPCWSLTLLPLNKNDTIENFMEDLAVDTKRGYIFAQSCLAEKGQFCLYSVNLHQHNSIRLAGLDTTVEILGRLDSVGFIEEGLYLRWHSFLAYGGTGNARDTIIVLR